MSGLDDEFDAILADLPRIRVDGDQVEIVNEPSEFYHRLKSLSASSKSRIIIASLYIGNGHLETELVDVVAASGAKKIRILLDHSRATRPPRSSCDVLRTVSANHADATLHLYHTPALRGLLRWLLPARWNEVVGLQHMKVYIFDDTTIISGANLSESYFTNRQDRCIIVKDCARYCATPERAVRESRLADAYEAVVDAVCSCSMKVGVEGAIELDQRTECHPYYGDRRKFTHQLHRRITAAMRESLARSATDTTKGDTLIWPYIHYGDVNLFTEFHLISQLLSIRNEHLRMCLASGYLNLLADYTSLISSSMAHIQVLAAAPSANGFYGARGLSRIIPDIYATALAHFVDATQHASDVDVRERPGWTFHAKGVWLSTDDDHRPFATFVGSSNYGYRSHARDMECGMVLHTTNTHLRRRMYDEQQSLLQHCHSVNAEAASTTSLLMRTLFRIVRRFF